MGRNHCVLVSLVLLFTAGAATADFTENGAPGNRDDVASSARDTQVQIPDALCCQKFPPLTGNSPHQCQALSATSEDSVGSETTSEFPFARAREQPDPSIQRAFDHLHEFQHPWFQTFDSCRETVSLLATSTVVTMGCLWVEGDLPSIFKEIQQAVSSPGNPGGLKSAFRHLCMKMPRVSECIEEVLQVVKSNLSLEDNQAPHFQNKNNPFQSLLEFLCKDDGTKIASLITSGEYKCLVGSLEQHHATCDKEFAALSGLPSIQIDDQKERATLLEERRGQWCRAFESSKRCWLDALRGMCKSELVSSLSEGLADILTQWVGCYTPSSAAVVTSQAHGPAIPFGRMISLALMAVLVIPK